MDWTHVVSDVKARLVTSGKDLSGPCGAFQITGRVAWILRDQGIGLIHKNPGQNGCSADFGRYAVDALMVKDGRGWDILVNAETENKPAWNALANPVDPELWRAPFDMDAGQLVPDPPPHPQPPVPLPPTPPGPPETTIMKLLDEMLYMLADHSNELDSLHRKLEHAKGQMDDIAEDVESIRVEVIAIPSEAPNYETSIFGKTITLRPKREW